LTVFLVGGAAVATTVAFNGTFDATAAFGCDFTVVRNAGTSTDGSPSAVLFALFFTLVFVFFGLVVKRARTPLELSTLEFFFDDREVFNATAVHPSITCPSFNFFEREIEKVISDLRSRYFSRGLRFLLKNVQARELTCCDSRVAQDIAQRSKKARPM